MFMAIFTLLTMLRPTTATFAVVLDRGIDHLLNTRDQRGESRHHDTTGTRLLMTLSRASPTTCSEAV